MPTTIKKNWKTTLAGAIAALAAYLVKDESLSPLVHQVADIVSTLAIAAMGFFASDASGGGTPPPPADKPSV